MHNLKIPNFNFSLIKKSKLDFSAITDLDVNTVYNIEQIVKTPKIEEETNFNKFDTTLKIGDLYGKNSFSFRVTLKEYKQGLNASKYSLLLNQFCIEPNNFISLINEILINNFPLSLFEHLFGPKLEEINLKIHFLVIISKIRPNSSSNNHFLIVPQGVFCCQLKSKIWPIFTNKLFYAYHKRFANTKLNKFNCIFLLVIYYLYKLIMLKCDHHINCVKFYSKEERQHSVGNYWTKRSLDLPSFSARHIRLAPNEQFMFPSNIADFANIVNKSFDLAYYENLKKNGFTKNELLTYLDA